MGLPLFLSGPMGAGKSTLGRLLAERSGARFLDTDAELERRSGQTVASLFASQGERAFRRQEAALVRHCLDLEGPLVVALGGGAVLDPETRYALLDRGIVLTLDASSSTLLERLGDEGLRARPLLASSGDPEATLRHLLETRRPVYQECHACLSTEGKTLENLAVEAESVWRSEPVAVALGARSYAVHIGAGVASRLPAELERLGVSSSGLLGVTDRIVGGLHRDRVGKLLQPKFAACPWLELPPGEPSKHLGSVEAIWDAALARGLGRDGLLLALGGGVVGDLAGFAAATLLRGVRVVQLPSTLLALVDSSVGGKTGIDRPQGKNLVGAFHQPSAVLGDTDWLQTLPEREYRAGLAEVLKMALIADAPLLTWMEREAEALEARDPEAIRQAARRAVLHKARIVREDEFETLGRRATLNFGHTLGHALEASTGYTLLHGEAVALGMVAALRVGRALGGQGHELPDRVVALLKRLGLPTELSAQAVEQALPYVGADKKRRGTAVGFILCAAPGRAETVRVELNALPALLRDQALS